MHFVTFYEFSKSKLQDIFITIKSSKYNKLCVAFKQRNLFEKRKNNKKQKTNRPLFLLFVLLPNFRTFFPLGFPKLRVKLKKECNLTQKLIKGKKRRFQYKNANNAFFKLLTFFNELELIKL